LKLEKGERGRDWSEERDLWDGKGGGGREFWICFWLSTPGLCSLQAGYFGSLLWPLRDCVCVSCNIPVLTPAWMVLYLLKPK
jgi:hypothetical protein